MVVPRAAAAACTSPFLPPSTANLAPLTPDAGRDAWVADALAQLTADVLRKDRRLTSVAIAHIPDAQWFVGGAALDAQRRASFFVDVRVTAVEPFDFGPPAAAVAPKHRATGVKITFFHPQVGKPQTLCYLSLDATDRALAANPEFLPFLAQFKGTSTFIKSASYLLHGNEFAGTRKALLEVSELMVQDDTGIPYRFLRERGFEVRLFGRYARPIKDFNYGYQKDLAAAYQQVGNVSILPFPFGYHWQEGRSGLMIARSTAKRS